MLFGKVPFMLSKRLVYRHKVFFTLVMLFVTWQLTGQVPVMRFSEPFNNELLTSNICTSVAQDSTGFIWIGTNDGLNCFNGSKVVQYKFNYSDSTSLVNNTINTLFVDKNGILWIGTQLGLCRYNKFYDNFEQLATEQITAGLGSVQINTIAEDSDGNIFISSGNSIYQFIDSTGEFKAIYSIERGNINKFIIDEKNNFWIGTSDDGLEYYDISEDKSTKIINTGSSNSISNNTIRDIALFNGSLWIATYGGGINAMNLKTFEIKHYPPPDHYAGYITYLYTDKENNLWSCDLTGLKIYDRETDSFFGYYSIEGDKKSVKNSIIAITQDRQGNYWTCHAPGGIGFRMASKGFVLYDKNPNNYWHLSENNVTTIETDNYGNWWIGNGFNGIDIFFRSENNIQTFHDEPGNPYSLGQGGTMCIYKDKNNRMWIGTNLGGLQYYNPENGRFYSYLNDPNDTNSIANNDIRSIAEDKEGNLWVVTHGRGIDYFDRKQDIFYHYTNAKNNLANDWAFQVLLDSEENLWVATAWGLSKLEKGSQSFQSYFSSSLDSTSLYHNQINCLYEDSQNQIWIGTNSGLNKYNPGDDNFIRIVLGFSSNNILAIEGSTDFLWLSTTNGISRYNKKNGEVYNFNESDGLIEGEYHLRSVAKNDEGLIFFGGPRGMSVFHPDNIKLNPDPPKVYITELNIFNEPVNNYKDGSVLEKQVMFTDEITLKFNQNAIGFEFVNDNLINIDKNRYKYKMEGADKEWVNSGKANTAFYSHLDPGNYTFRVIASNNDNVWNETGTSLKIRVLPPWYLKWWCKILWGLIILFMIVLIFRIRTSNLKKRNKWLAQKVEERTQRLFQKNELLKEQAKILDDTNRKLKIRQEVIQKQSDDLKLQGEELKVTAENLEELNKQLKKSNDTKDKLFSIIGHDLRNPFNIILGYTDLLIENLEDWDYNQTLELLLMLKESSVNTFNLLENLLNWAKSQSGELKFFPENVQLNEVAESVLTEVSSFAVKKNIKLIHNINTNIILWADFNMLNLTCRNLLMNAIKFSNPGSSIYFKARNFDTNKIIFEIRDEGVGIAPEKINGIFKSDINKSTVGTDGEKGTGLGLLLCKEFVNLHGGRIWVESQVGSGSSFFFTIMRIL
ncbi:MAG: hypothetical protein JXR31_11190 [Prolixibacteraceae bacterium]|nr:hypothetical protein [Prolixibacteraceae bacterium]